MITSGKRRRYLALASGLGVATAIIALVVFAGYPAWLVALLVVPTVRVLRRRSVV